MLKGHFPVVETANVERLPHDRLAVGLAAVALFQGSPLGRLSRVLAGFRACWPHMKTAVAGLDRLDFRLIGATFGTGDQEGSRSQHLPDHSLPVGVLPCPALVQWMRSIALTVRARAACLCRAPNARSRPAPI